jgi:molybdopterin biosynthesis enzyme MoaB
VLYLSLYNLQHCFTKYVSYFTVSDSCYQGKAKDKSGTNLAALIAKGIIPNGEVVLQACVPDEKDFFIKVIRNLI